MKRALAALLLCLVSEALPAENGQPKGRLCWTKGDRPVEFDASCVATAGRQLDIQPTETSRRFVWLHADGVEIAAGTVEAQAKTIDLGARNLVDVTLALESSDEEAFPLPVTIHISPGNHAEPYRLTIPARATASLRRLRLPEGAYALELSADRHRSVVRRVNASASRAAGLGTVVLERHLELAGRVLSKDGGTPIVGAEIRLPSEELAATTDELGRFVGYVVDDWPDTIRVSAPSYGTRVVPLPKVRADADLADIVLSKGGTVRASVACDCEATAVLQRVLERKVAPIATQRINERKEPVVFTDVEPGDYQLMVKGNEPLQRMATELVVKEAEVTDLTVTIEPVTLEAVVLAGNEPIGDAQIELSHTPMQWAASLRTDERGTATVELWQQGDFAAFVTTPRSPTPFVVLQKLSGVHHIPWKIELPKRKVLGRVVDGAGAGVPNASIFLETWSANGSAQTHVTSDGSGKFEFAFVEAGKQTLTVSASGFANAVRHFQLGDRAEVHEERVVLERAVSVRVLVTDHRGLPVSGCTVVDTSLTKKLLQTDEAGFVEVPLRVDETKVVYFVPRTGSFAAVPLTARKQTTGSPARVTIPLGDATLLVRSQTTNGEPLPNVALMMRVNGQLIPPPVLDQIRLLQGTQFYTGAEGRVALRNMPSGLYELWPHFSLKEAWDIMNGLGPEPPVRMIARAGENVATLTFAKESR